LIFQTQDITSRKKAENELLYKASHDSLTGLCNRSAFTTLLEKALKREKSKEVGLLVVLFLDLDGFKLVNDSLGHVIGDELLKGTAERLLECVRGIDTVARMGGDEFTILLENLQDVAQGVRVAERIKQRLSEPFFFGGQEIFVGTSIGIATSLISYAEPGEILRDADAAMYQAKARGKSCHVVFDYEMHANAMRHLRLANDLRRAIERHEFAVNFQLIQSLENNNLCGFEALVRWNHPFYGLLMPSEFVPLAEENGLINSIDNWMLTKACVQMREWHENFPASKKMIISVNISTKQFGQTGLVEHIKRVLEQSGLPAKNLQLEITESAMMKNLKNTAKVLRELCAIGVRIALDDFGTGYSSLSYLHELPISTLKIDRSFVQQLNAKADRAEIVRAIITLARSLKMNVVAEGIETKEQLEHLRQMGCNFGQGYLFSRPVSNAQASEIVQKSFEPQIDAAFAKPASLRLVS
ncbi:MAG: bifunctional diguanylate cyclase/phosphodiesterase, partial [Pyrinomonadaceae bacterium]|nr:bifunctional diguanylate cyclase/phosphodiesterase [Pyrinomonadaceae bacterium]